MHTRLSPISPFDCTRVRKDLLCGDRGVLRNSKVGIVRARGYREVIIAALSVFDHCREEGYIYIVIDGFSLRI